MYSWRVALFASFLMMFLVVTACVPLEVAVESSDTGDAMPAESAEGEVEHVIHWGYEGEGGPENWGDLNSDYEVCGTGMEQSPIDLTDAELMDLENIGFSYRESAINILNNGHTIQIKYDEGSSIDINGQSFELLQFHFHAPSEHAVNGQLYPAEMHLVHADNEGRLAVVGVLIAEGAENPAFAPVWENLPHEETEAIATGMIVNAADLLPTQQVFYRYNGSLTTPPCSQGVLWSVMESPVEMSAQQIGAFTDIFQGTNRPVQPINTRTLQLDTTP